jgi:hypothetical protein
MKIKDPERKHVSNALVAVVIIILFGIMAGSRDLYMKNHIEKYVRDNAPYVDDRAMILQRLEKLEAAVREEEP